MPAPREKPIIGIDLGTTNACVAHVRNRIPKVVPTDRGSLILPTVVALSERGDVLVGGVAKDQLVTNPKNTIYGAKRLIGRKWSSKVVQELRNYYSYDICEGPNGEAAVLLGGKVHTLPEISAMVLAHIKKIAEAFLEKDIGQAIISVPAYYSDAQRQAVREAGGLAGFEVKRIVNEPTAAALAYGFSRGLDQKVLVYDLGGGTFDVSVLQLSGTSSRCSRPAATRSSAAWTSTTGSSTSSLEEFWRRTRSTSPTSPIAMQRVKKGAEAAKIDLSLIPNVAIDLPYIEEKKGRPLDIRMPLSRQQLDELTGDLVDRTFAICDGCSRARASARRTSTRSSWSAARAGCRSCSRRSSEHFGKPPRKGVHPDECVALGAALLGDSLDAIDSVTLVDVLSMPIGIATPAGHLRKVLDKNTTIPTSRSFRLPPPREPGQPIEIDIYQGESDFLVDNEFLGSIRLPAAATGRRIDFKLDEECLLKVTFDDPARGMTAVELATRDTPEALRRALAEEARRREAGGRRAGRAGRSDGAGSSGG